jgi:nicotinamide-nucleotide amidase
LLGVDPELIRRHGAVSEPVARAMAEGCRERTGAAYGLSVTGFAGPDGGTEAAPVGTVYIGLAGPDGTLALRIFFGGERNRVRRLAAQTALDLMRRKM